MDIDPVISTNKIAPATSQLFNPASNGAPSSVGLQDSIANGSAFQDLVNLGNNNSLLPPSRVNAGGLFEGINAKNAKLKREVVSLAKNPDPVKMTAHVLEKSNAVLGLTFLTRMAGQFTKSVNQLTNMN